MLQRFLTMPNSASKHDMDYLVDKMDKISTATRRSMRLAKTA